MKLFAKIILVFVFIFICFRFTELFIKITDKGYWKIIETNQYTFFYKDINKQNLNKFIKQFPDISDLKTKVKVYIYPRKLGKSDKKIGITVLNDCIICYINSLILHREVRKYALKIRNMKKVKYERYNPRRKK